MTMFTVSVEFVYDFVFSNLCLRLNDVMWKYFKINAIRITTTYKFACFVNYKSIEGEYTGSYLLQSFYVSLVNQKNLLSFYHKRVSNW